MKAKLQPVRIEWLDSHQYDGWRDKDQAADNSPDLRMVSVGFLVREDEDGVTITDTLGSYGVNNPFTIPRCAITKLVRLPQLAGPWNE